MRSRCDRSPAALWCGTIEMGATSPGLIGVIDTTPPFTMLGGARALSAVTQAGRYPIDRQMDAVNDAFVCAVGA
jgi:hypothetical protein